MCMHVCLCTQVQALRGQRKALDPLELEGQGVVNCLLRVQGTER